MERHLFSPTNIPQLDGFGSFTSIKGLEIQAWTPTVAPLVQCMCQCSPSTPLFPIQLLATTLPNPRPLHSLSPPHPSLKHIKQLQPTQILAQLKPFSFPPISTLPEKEEPEPEQQTLKNQFRCYNYSTGGMLEATLDVNYSTRGILYLL